MSAALQIVPEEESPKLRRLPKTVRDEYDRICTALPGLLAAKSLLAACKEKSPHLKMSARALYERIRNYRSSQNWLDLVNKAKGGKIVWRPAAPGTQPAIFQEWCKGIFERFQRNNRAGYREIIHIWSHHRDTTSSPVKYYDAIPGYAAWPEADRLGRHPEGWSYQNLRRFAPDNYDAAASRQGLFTASQFRPPVFTSRVGLRVLQRVEFDDHEFNLKIHWPGQSKMMRPRGFFGLDTLTNKEWPSFKPTLWDEEDEVKKTLTERDFMWFLVNHLVTVGYRADDIGTWLVVELGTSTVRKDFAARILRATGDKVRVDLPGMFNRPAHGGQFGGKGAGNFRHKPRVEGSFALIDTYFSGLPAQTGLSRLRAPEDGAGREQYLGQLLRAAKTLPSERAEQLILPCLTWGEFFWRANDLVTAIMETSEHEIEGWDELNFHELQFRLPLAGGFTDWQYAAMLDKSRPEERAAIEAMLNAATETHPLRRAVRMSRQRAFDRHYAADLAAGQIKKINVWQFADLMGLENGHEVSVGANNLITVEKKELGPSPLRFLAAIGNHHLPSGGKYLGFINPWQPHCGMLLTKPNGAEVGVCEFWDTPGAEDHPAVLRQVGRQGHWEAARKHALEGRHAGEAAAVKHMRAHNAAVLDKKLLASDDAKNEEARARIEAALDKASQQY